MPIKIPDNLPARHTLEAEGVVVMDEQHAVLQDIRPLRIGLLNLMPNKISTETQIARLLGATPLQIELTLVRITSHIATHTSPDHMAAFYRPWHDVRNEYFDGFIITGAPVERLPFDEVRYWDELREIFDWTQTNVHQSLAICWGAQASLHHFYETPKHALAQKALGIFTHQNNAPTSPYLRGFSDEFPMPVSRWTETRAADLPHDQGLILLAESEQTGIGLLHDPAHRTLHMFNHLEYDTTTLSDEFHRDGASQLPENYFPDGDITRLPRNHWRGHAHLLFGNWINEIYQTTPFDLTTLGQTTA